MGESRLKNKLNEEEKKKNKLTSTILSFSLIRSTILPIPAPSFCKKKCFDTGSINRSYMKATAGEKYGRILH